MDYLSSDFHFAHTNVIKYCNRPFSSIEEMDDIIIYNINKLVQPDDTLWCLGDFTFKNHDEYRKLIKCKNVHLILGNHDKIPKNKLKDIFTSVENLHRIKVNYKNTVLNIVLCHYAMRIWELSHYGSIHCYGHSHYTLPDDPNALSMDVGVDAVAGRATGYSYQELKDGNLWHLLKPENYKPINIEDVYDFMSKKLLLY
mgnify:CR=1 FL=1